MFLVSALLISLVVALFVGAALRLSIGNLKASSGNRQHALLAAESGLRYVQTRLAADYRWDADGGLMVNDTDMIVYEVRGNVIGLVRAAGGGFAQFRIRFNYQDDAQGDVDGFTDPPAEFVIDHPYVSVNNIMGGAAKSVPRADGPGWSVTSGSERPYKVPGSSTCVIVEGRYGPGLGNLSSSALNPEVKGTCSTQIIEACLQVNEMAAANSVASSAGDTLFVLDTNSAVTLSAKDKNSPSRIRSRAKIGVQGGDSPNLKAEDGEAYTRSGTVDADDDGIRTEVEDASTDFYRLPWSEVRKADSSDSKLNAGTYVVWDDGTLHYYDMDYTEYVSFIYSGGATDPGTVVDPSTLPSGFAFNGDPSDPTFSISENLYVDHSSTTASEFNLIPRAGVQEDPPGVSAQYGVDQLIARTLNSLPNPSDVDGGWFVFGGSEKATWTIPITGSVPGGEIELREETLFGILQYKLVLRDAGPGKAELLLHDNLFSDFSPKLRDDPVGALEDAMTDEFGGSSKVEQIAGLVVGGLTMSEFDFSTIAPSTTPPSLRADDIRVLFEPPEGTSAILSSDGTIRIGSNVRGDGGSITAGRALRIVGNGTDLSASLSNGLTLYARDDLVLSSLKETSVGSNSWMYKDLNIKGVLYSCGNIDVKMNHSAASVTDAGSLLVEGSVVAYGGDPGGAPGSGFGGDILAWSEDTELKYNPTYLLRMDLTPPPGTLSQILHTTY